MRIWFTSGSEKDGAASQLPEVDGTTEKAVLVALAEVAYAHLKHNDRTAKIAELVDFVTRMNVGDAVLTTGDADDVYVGDVTGTPSFVTSVENRSNLRRPVDWRNPEIGIDFASLPGSLQAKFKTGSTLADITGELSAIDQLINLGLDEVEAPVTATLAKTRPPHVEFRLLSAEIASELFVSQAWLDEVVELLNEKRQLVLYGPPGTGKTFLARRIAAHLVGEQQVRLVQFHPS